MADLSKELSKELNKDFAYCEDTISRKAAIDALVKAIREDPYYDSNEAINGLGVCDVRVILNDLPSAQPQQIVRCKDCKHNPKLEWFGCPMSHLNEKQRPETAWCWKGERKDDE